MHAFISRLRALHSTGAQQHRTTALTTSASDRPMPSRKLRAGAHACMLLSAALTSCSALDGGSVTTYHPGNFALHGISIMQASGAGGLHAPSALSTLHPGARQHGSYINRQHADIASNPRRGCYAACVNLN